MSRVRTSPLDRAYRHLVMEQIQKLKLRRSEKLRDMDAEIERLQTMLDTGLVPQTCGA
ncbi:MAG: hypothetical protein P0Y65_05605 [Candidatus Devosia phytovorans]|uniref:Uncharacterized protein n=1 Tax=Candidatus Devosia phytovorans TaxID=3121372 RepID=A0AAJ5VXI5_9HYPH|nr:hypothetical protein [Devosia sp.]WEK05730.1 MAG: hypothetical protein P0Y65_05605 [Devosia sp.]